ncbi:MAG TPA: efflux RND transporter periplasmic adaptor subunit [Gammaproteobacteria bacterium]|nr:efflux RND transporter periplasmic adaptor subunit [Gammaproteobacteria bacterium]
MKSTLAHIVFLTLLACGLALGLSGCGGNAAQAKEAAQDTTPAIPVETATAKRAEVAATYSGTTTLEAAEEATVVAKVGGTVAQIYAEEGRQVRAGDALAQLDDTELRYDAEEAQANYEKKQQEFARSQALYDRHLISTDAFDSVKYDLAVLKATYDIAKLNLDRTRIRSPIDGVVAKRLIKVGNTLTPNQAVYVVTDFNPLLAVLYVPENALARIRPGQPATLSADALAGQSFTGRVARLSPVVDPQTGTFKVTVEVAHNERGLAPGMFSRVNITYDVHKDALTVPRAAILTEDGESAVYVVDGGVAHRVPVSLGYADGDRIEITRGLKNGDNVVTLGQNSLKDGTKVAVVNASPQKATALRSDKTAPSV